jgi:hypothetical protein
MRSSAGQDLGAGVNMLDQTDRGFAFGDDTHAEFEHTETASTKAPLILSLIAISMFLPEEASFAIGNLRMTVIRLLLLLVAPVTIWRLLQMIVQRRYVFIWSDVFVPLASLWMFVGPISVDGFDKSIAYCGSSALEFLIPYLAARTFLREQGQAVALVRVLSIAIAVTGFLAIVDEVSGRFIIRETFNSIFGSRELNEFVDYTHPEQRGILLRVPSTLDHPILLGTVCVFGLLLATTLRGGARIFALLGSATGLILAASSAPIVGTAMGFGCLLFEKATRNVPHRWGLLLLAVGSPLLLISVVHPSPLSFFLNHLTIDPQTGYYRLLQWDCVGDLVLDSPIFGMGLSNEWADYCHIARTIDAFWLREAMLYGIPGAVLIFLCYASACISPRRPIDESVFTDQEKQLKLVLNVTLLVTIWIGFTVHYWGSAYILTLFLTGIGAHLGALEASLSESEHYEENVPFLAT